MADMHHDRTKRILVSMPTGSHTQRRKLEGILQYVRERHGASWRLQLDLGGFVRQRLRRLADWRCDGIIAYIDNPSARRHFLSAKLPTVLIEPFLSPRSNISNRRNVVTFINDHSREGKTAAEYFLSHNYRNFAYVGLREDSQYNALRRKGFADAVRAAGSALKSFFGN